LAQFSFHIPPPDFRCGFKRSTVGAEDTGFVDLKEGDEDALKVAVATQGPVSVAIDAGHRSFQVIHDLYTHCILYTTLDFS